MFNKAVLLMALSALCAASTAEEHSLHAREHGKLQRQGQISHHHRFQKYPQKRDAAPEAEGDADGFVLYARDAAADIEDLRIVARNKKGGKGKPGNQFVNTAIQQVPGVLGAVPGLVDAFRPKPPAGPPPPPKRRDAAPGPEAAADADGYGLYARDADAGADGEELRVLARGKPGGKPSGGKPSGGKPSGGKPSGGKPSGGKPSGGKPMSQFGQQAINTGIKQIPGVLGAVPGLVDAFRPKPPQKRDAGADAYAFYEELAMRDADPEAYAYADADPDAEAEAEAWFEDDE